MSIWGRFLRVELARSKFRDTVIPEDEVRMFLGGRGMAVKILHDEAPPYGDPLIEPSVFVIATGPLTGTRTPSSGRHLIASKSPVTGGIGWGSAGGDWAAELRRAGYDGIIITGRAPKLTYLWIKDGAVEFRDATKFRGKFVSEVDDAIRAETDSDAKVTQIGPAGELKSYLAGTLSEKHRFAGRGGLGAVLGSKNLRAIAVRGTKDVEVADPEGLPTVNTACIKKLEASDFTKVGGAFNSFGTAVTTNVMNASGMLPTRNFQSGVFPDAGKISGETMAETILTDKTPCYRCPIACGRRVKVGTGKYAGTETESLEYETTIHFGANCGINDLGALAKASELCNEYGLDTIQTGSTIAFAMELVERGILSKDEVGLDLVFGNDEAMIKMVELMGKREGFGAILADGNRIAARRIGKGAEYYAIQVKGLIPAAFDPRGAFGMGLTYATGNRGACHVTGITVNKEIFGFPEKVDPFDSGKEKVAYTIEIQNEAAAIASSLNCLFLTYGIGLEDYVEMIKCVTGWKDYSLDEFLKTGERVYALERVFNARAGFGRKDDTLPERFLKEPLPEGPAQGKVVPLAEMLDTYYELRGYDSEGHPKEEKLKELGLMR